MMPRREKEKLPYPPGALAGTLAAAFLWASLALVCAFLLAVLRWWGFLWFLAPLGLYWLVAALALITEAPLPTPLRRVLRR